MGVKSEEITRELLLTDYAADEHFLLVVLRGSCLTITKLRYVIWLYSF